MEMKYVAPELEVLEVLVEAGFAGSNATGGNADTGMEGSGGIEW